LILAGDVGATKILLEAGDVDEGRWKPFLARRYLIADFPNMSGVMEAFLAEWQSAKPARARLTSGALGVAGPADGNSVKMTHRPWEVDGDALADHFGIPRIRVVNDLAAMAHGIDAVASRDIVTIQPGRAVPGAPQVVLGVGTGLGVAYRFQYRGQTPVSRQAENRGLTPVLPGEGGHVGFSPASAEQYQVWKDLHAVHGRVEGEDVASGKGIANIFKAFTGRNEETAAICERAIAKTDDQACEALGVFAECLGNVAGDHALAVMARGGIFLAGGVIARIAPSIRKERLCAAFCAKGVMSSLLMRIPIRAITNEKLGVLGAARMAQERV
jgi:glucokinase